jgi:hypothetical protein
MIWPSYLDQHNTPEGIKALYDDPRVLTRDEIKTALAQALKNPKQ